MAHKARNVLESFQFAFQGFRVLLAQERNYRIHLCITVLVVGAGLWFGIDRMEWLLLVFAIVLMLALEAMNTSIEYLADVYCGRQYDPHVKIVKDVAAAACMVGAVGSAVIGLLVFGPHLLQWLQ